MMLENDQQLANTRALLNEVQERYDQAKIRDMPNDAVRRVTLHSLKKLINQLTEEIVRYTSRHPVSR